MKTLGKLILFAVSFAISAFAAHWWLEDWTLVWILMLSILLHEFGHWLTLFIYGLEPTMFFVPLLGAAVAAPNWQEKLDHMQMAIVALAGPLVNFALVIVGLILWLDGSEYGMKMASLNAALVWFNLIPLFILDGQKFAKAVFASLNEDGDRAVAGVISILAIIAGIGLAFAGKLGFFYLLIYFGIRRESEKDDPSEAYSHKAMTESQAMSLTAVYALIMFSTMILAAFLPHWTG